MKFKTGDKVKVISLDKTKKYFEAESMEKFLGKTVTIQGTSITSYFLNEYIYRGDGWTLHEDDLQLFTTELEVE
jgi:hypothetical protein